MEAPIPDVNPAEVDVVLPDPEPHGEDGRLGLRALLLVRYAVGAQLGPPSSPVARLKAESGYNKMRERHDSDIFRIPSQIRV